MKFHLQRQTSLRNFLFNSYFNLWEKLLSDNTFISTLSLTICAAWKWIIYMTFFMATRRAFCMPPLCIPFLALFIGWFSLFVHRWNYYTLHFTFTFEWASLAPVRVYCYFTALNVLASFTRLQHLGYRLLPCLGPQLDNKYRHHYAPRDPHCTQWRENMAFWMGQWRRF